ncbi:MAG: hypothetical protein AB7P49_16525 [Bdellovibrionales bacterium]
MYKTSFEETYERFPSPYGVIQQFQRTFPVMSDYVRYSSCLKVDEKSAPVIGAIDPLQGSALEREPGALFYQFYQDCMHELSKSVFNDQSLSSQNSEMILGKKLDAAISSRLERYPCENEKGLADACAYTDAQSKKWAFWTRVQFNQLDMDLQLEIMNQFIEFLIGPEEVLDGRGYTGEDTVFGVPVANQGELALFIIRQLSGLESRDPKAQSSLVYEIYAETAVLLRLGPALKN